ncbi:MAG: hypothetical protein Q4P30_06175 [Eubacteriales bacterium]|nr:hypothetical protein [Eubacteriales bacterium]
MKKIMAISMLAFCLASCSWNFYDEDGKTRMTQKYPTGSSVYYKDGTFSRDHHHNQYRPEQHVIQP